MSAKTEGARIVAEHLGPREGNPLMQQIGRSYERLIVAIDQAIVARGERAASKVPTNWIDGLLTGPEAVIGKPPYSCTDIEDLLRAIAAAIRKDNNAD